MSRWLAYPGTPNLLEAILFKPASLLVDQSMSSKATEKPANVDGVGVDWYDDRPAPGLVRSIRPAWKDFKLHGFPDHIESPRVLARVCGSSQAVVPATAFVVCS